MSTASPMIVETSVEGRLVIVIYRRPGGVRARRVPRPRIGKGLRHKALYGIPTQCSREVLPGPRTFWRQPAGSTCTLHGRSARRARRAQSAPRARPSGRSSRWRAARARNHRAPDPIYLIEVRGSMTETGLSDRERPRAHGKFIDVGDTRLWVRGVTYGTFRAGPDGTQFPERQVVERDFAAMAAAGFNAVRTYTLPPVWLLDAAAAAGLRVLAG